MKGTGEPPNRIALTLCRLSGDSKKLRVIYKFGPKFLVLSDMAYLITLSEFIDFIWIVDELQ